MKANNMSYRTVQDEKLVLWLPGATMEDALGMETDIIRIRTDAGDEVEALCGFGNLVSVTYIAESNTMVVTLTRKADSGVGAALDALSAQLVESEKENKLLKAQVSAATERSDFIEDCIAEMAVQVYSDEV